MVKISPSILSADFSNLLADIKKVEEAGCDLLHIDVMDGHFVPNITLGPMIIEALRQRTQLLFDVHLMIEKPERYIKDFLSAGADILTIHTEACVHLHRAIYDIKNSGIKAGVALNPSTPLTSIEYILDDLDMVLIMTVNPGFGGQSFIPTMLDKIKKLKTIIRERGLNIDIQVDGGINPQNIHLLTGAGANIIVAGSAIFNSENIKDRVELLENNAKMGLV